MAVLVLVAGVDCAGRPESVTGRGRHVAAARGGSRTRGFSSAWGALVRLGAAAWWEVHWSCGGRRCLRRWCAAGMTLYGYRAPRGA